MKASVQIHRSRRNIERILEMARQDLNDMERQAHLVRYACVLISGFIETSVRAILTEVCQHARPEVRCFAQAKLEGFQNPTMDKIERLVRDFCPAWADELRDSLPDEVREAVNSVVANRHRIAHGRDSSVGLVAVRDWFKGSITLVDELERMCK